MFHKSQCALRYRDPMSKIQNTSSQRSLVTWLTVAEWWLASGSQPCECSASYRMTERWSGSALVTHSTQATPPWQFATAVHSYITEICAELLLARWAPHFDYNSPAGYFWVVAGSNDPWRCGLASPSMGSWINSAGVLPHFAEDDPSLEALEGGRTVRQWIT